MVELSSGSKRRLSNTDENERITLRQMVLNMSICKLQKDQGRKEPSLLRSVIITNTVRNIENEMDEEMMLNFSEDSYFPPLAPINNSMQMQSDDPFTSQDTQSNLEKTYLAEAEKDDVQSFVESNKLTMKEANKFGAIGDHRRGKFEKTETVTKPAKVLSGFLWDSLTQPVFNAYSPVLENVDLESNFPDVDITLYDYDNSSALFPQQLQVQDWRVFPNSCAAEYERRRPDSFFEELDQIMQVLVGM